MTLWALFFDTNFRSLDNILETPENTRFVLNKAGLVVKRIIGEARRTKLPKVPRNFNSENTKTCWFLFKSCRNFQKIKIRINIKLSATKLTGLGN